MSNDNVLYFLPEYQAKMLIFGQKTVYKEALEHLKTCVTACPRTYQTENQKVADKVAWLRYSNSSVLNWYIIEKDINDEQYQAFGIVEGFEIEFSYINIAELRKFKSIKLDLNWKPTPLSQIASLKSFLIQFER